MSDKDTLLEEIARLYSSVRRIKGMIPEDYYDWKIHGEEASRVFKDINIECIRAEGLPKDREPKVDCDYGKDANL
jgi:hypothetical protein